MDANNQAAQTEKRQLICPHNVAECGSVERWLHAQATESATIARYEEDRRPRNQTRSRALAASAISSE